MDPDIERFYVDGDEATRHSRSIGPLESARTQELIRRYLPPAPATIVDIGAGPGAYSIWLAQLGYEVHAIDVIEKHIRQLRERLRAANVRLGSIHLSDARELPLADSIADLAILHGPLYHLTARDDRLAALREAGRVLKPGGVVMGFAITPGYASAIVGLARTWIWDRDYTAMCDEEIATGQHRRPSSWPTLFTTSYFHAADELKQEMQEAGFRYDALLGVQGIGWLGEDFTANWADPAKRQIILKLARQMENDPVLSPHFVGIGRK